MTQKHLSEWCDKHVRKSEALILHKERMSRMPSESSSLQLGFVDWWFGDRRLECRPFGP